ALAQPRSLHDPGAGWSHLQPEPPAARPVDATNQASAHRVPPDPARTRGDAALRPVDGLRGEPRRAPLRLRVDARGARRSGPDPPAAAPAPPPPPPLLPL